MKTEHTRRHPGRSQLMQHMESSDPKIAQHLKICADCRTTIAALCAFRITRQAGRHRHNPESLIQRVLSLPPLVSGPTGEPIYARCVSDSWQRETLTAVRNAAHGVERRVRFHAVKFTIDLVVDRLGDCWECSMRLSRRGKAVTRFVVTVDSATKLPVDTGFFSWSSHRPPRNIRLWSSDLNICLESMSW